MTDKEMLNGIVVRAQTGVYYVQHNGRVLECVLRGKVKRELQTEDGKNIYKDPVAVGDNVLITEAEGDKGAIEDILPRKSKLSRMAPGSYLRVKAKQTRVPKRMKSSGGRFEATQLEQIVVANADQLLVILSTKEPTFNPGLLDRFLVIAEAGDLESVICINKMDLLNGKGQGKLREKARIYADIGYKVLFTSAVNREGLEELVEVMKGKLSALAGPSGAGKSTLLNAIQPGLHIRTAEVSDATHKGKHTTTNVELHTLDFGGYVVDTPGIRELGLWDIWKEEMHLFFPEIEPYVILCRFSDCMHIDEPGCAVKEAIGQGKIAESRYESYLKMRSAAHTGFEMTEKFSDRKRSK